MRLFYFSAFYFSAEKDAHIFGVYFIFRYKYGRKKITETVNAFSIPYVTFAETPLTVLIRHFTCRDTILQHLYTQLQAQRPASGINWTQRHPASPINSLTLVL